MRRSPFVLALALVAASCATPVRAQPIIFEDVAVQTGFSRFEDLLTGARGSALGNADFATHHGAMAVWSNPAPLFGSVADVDWTSSIVGGYRPAVTVEARERNVFLHAATFASGRWSVGFGTKGYEPKDILVRTAFDPEGTTDEGISRRDYALSVAFDLGSVLLPEESWLWSVGMGLSRFSSVIRGQDEPVDSLELGTTLGWRRSGPGHDLSITAALAGLNAISRSRLFEGSDLLLPGRFRAGATVKIARRAQPDEEPWLSAALSLAVTHDDLEDADDATHVGFELGLRERVYIRVGRESASFDDFTGYGVGLRWPLRERVVFTASYARQMTSLEVFGLDDDFDIELDSFDLGIAAGF